jgi:hypothetical protein
METHLQTLKTHLHEYRETDEALKSLNQQTTDLRQHRKAIEIDMAKILTLPDFQEFEKLELSEDGSIVKIQRPNTWNKPWSLSKSELMDGLDEYFAKNSNTSAEDCYEFLVKRQQPKMVASEFAFERVIPKKRKAT